MINAQMLYQLPEQYISLHWWIQRASFPSPFFLGRGNLICSFFLRGGNQIRISGGTIWQWNHHKEGKSKKIQKNKCIKMLKEPMSFANSLFFSRSKVFFLFCFFVFWVVFSLGLLAPLVPPFANELGPISLHRITRSRKAILIRSENVNHD